MAAMAVSTFLFLSFTLSLALDMSIISHTHNHEQLNWRSGEEVMAIYEGWLTKHQIVHNGLEEKNERFQVFRDNLKFIDKYNAQSRTHKLGLYRFADLFNKEYRAMYFGTRTDAKRRVMKAKNIGHRNAYNAGDMLPLCGLEVGSCWAFSTVATVAAINKIVTGELVSLSEQEPVECDRSNNGCNAMGASWTKPLSSSSAMVASTQTTTSRTKGHDDKCDPTKKRAKAVKIDGYEDVPAFDENALKKAVAHQPVSVAIEASGRALQ